MFVLFCVLALLVQCMDTRLLRSEDVFHDLIYNGKKVTSTDFFYQISMEDSKTKDHFCGGTIIAKNFVLTASHCTDGKQPEDFKVRSQTFTKGKGGKTMTCMKIIEHENYDRSTMMNDVALLLVDPLYQFHAGFKPMEMLDTETDFTGQKGTVAGWGVTETQDTPKRMLSTEVPVLTTKKCNKVLQEYEMHDMFEPNTMICAGQYKEQNACRGDSGGGFIINKKVVGIVSWTPLFEGVPLCDAVAVYTKVSAFIDWINKNMQEHE